MNDSISATASTEPKEALNIAKFTGNYYLLLGALTLLAMLISNLIGHGYLDVSFILWFWLGSCLKTHSRGARAWAIFISVFVSLSMLFALTSSGSEFTFGSRTFGNTDPEAYLISAVLWTVFAIPASLLLTRNGRESFSIRQEYFRNKSKA